MIKLEQNQIRLENRPNAKMPNVSDTPRGHPKHDDPLFLRCNILKLMS